MAQGASSDQQRNKRRRHRAIVHSHWLHRRMPVVSDCGKACCWPTARNLVHWPRQRQHILDWMKNCSFAFEASRWHFDETVIHSLNAAKTVFIVNIHSQGDASSKESNICRLVRQVTIPTHMQAAVCVSGQGAGLIKIETHDYVFKCWSSMTAQVLIDSLPGKRFYVYIENMTAEIVYLPIMKVTYALSSQT